MPLLIVLTNKSVTFIGSWIQDHQWTGDELSK